ncbi:hypothetical protein [Chitinophaga sp. XS-30]|uniref:hypothetical protein n=1 Tax=Chitinophaga sp. XS-30 TaxID=2604421 RepID=UPI0011DD3653|nr:hypothetical protein [Chitinophaga sp. XS-30]QEH41144.1 hypothetical protein FW415_09760 [Chitinophaga sp. XS-30]
MRKNIPVLLPLLFIMIMAGCTKKVSLPEIQTGCIAKFEIATAYGNIPAIINDDSRQITLQLPYYLYDLKFVDPEIRLAEGATITPASGERVDLSATPVQYTVKTRNGTVETYTLMREILQLGTQLNELSTAEDTFTSTMLRNIAINGSHLIPDTNSVRVILTNTAGQQFTFTPREVSQETVILYIYDDNTIDSGLYHVQVKNLNDTVSLQYPIRINYPEPYLNLSYRKDTVKQGDVLTITGTSIRGLEAFAIYSNTGRTSDIAAYYHLEIVSSSLSELKLKIPDDLPAGQYPSSGSILRTRQQFNGGAYISKNYSQWVLVVEPK